MFITLFNKQICHSFSKPEIMKIKIHIEDTILLFKYILKANYIFKYIFKPYM